MTVLIEEPAADPAGPDRVMFFLHMCNVLMLMKHRSK